MPGGCWCTSAPPHPRSQIDAGLGGRVWVILERAAVEESETGGWISRTEIWDQLHRNGDAAALDGALTALVADGVAESREVPTGTNKRVEWRLTHGRLTREEEPVAMWEDETPATNGNHSYEEFTPSFGSASRSCYACGGERFAPDGVCLICHPRPAGHHMETGS